MDSRNAIKDKRVVLFDGVCNLCNWSVQFIIKRDPKGLFKFASLQSDFGKKLMEENGQNPDVLESIILVDGDNTYFRSRAALEIAKRLTGLWPLFYVFRIVPSGILDVFYNLIAKNRYRWFGRQDQCMIPTKDLSLRFIE